MESHNLILLTGAGFTKNFNGFTGEEMWLQIFNDLTIQRSPALRSLLLDSFDFEYVYGEVLSGRYSEIDKSTIRLVVERAYKKLDDATRTWTFNSSNPTALDTHRLQKLLSLFEGNRRRPGLFFTLNQDLLMERKHDYCSLAAPRFLAGGRLEDQPFSDQSWVSLPSDDPTKKIEAALRDQRGPLYVKLHGSYGWKSSDGSSQMVIGKDKEGAIKKEPLLRQYFELFQSVIKEGNKCLLVIGYGFGDMHINEVLCDGVKNHGLKLVLVNTTSPYQFRENLMNGHYYATELRDGIIAHFQNTLREIFPPNQSGSTYLDDLTSTLLQAS